MLWDLEPRKVKLCRLGGEKCKWIIAFPLQGSYALVEYHLKADHAELQITTANPKAKTEKVEF